MILTGKAGETGAALIVGLVLLGVNAADPELGSGEIGAAQG
jgi:hypothetical protein